MAKDTPPHELIAQLSSDPNQAPSLSYLVGLLGQSPFEGHVRLYLDAELGSCIDIPKDDVVHVATLDQRSLRPNAVWVKSSSTLQVRYLKSTEQQAHFLTGSIAARHMT